MSSKSKSESRRRLSAGLRAEMMNKLRSLQPGRTRNESERDSGFSDVSSEYLSAVDQTDSEDAPKTPGQNRSSRPQPPQMAVLGGSYPGLSPMIIMNKILLKQSGHASPPVKPWGFHQGLEVIPPPQVVFLQPVISNSNATPPKSPQDKRRRSEKYLPILKSYPKIAPHPGDGSSENSGSSSSGVSSVSSAREGRVSVLRHRRHSRDKRQSRPIWSASPALSSLPPTPSSQSSPREESSTLTGSLSTKMEDTPLSGQPAQTKVSQESALSLQSPRMLFPPPESETASLPSQACPTPDPSMSESEGEGSHCSLSDNRNKRKRFCNTYNILHKSGLLGITLRTKDLIRQNRKTQLELERLKEQTCLFVQAVNSGDPQVWTKLQLAMLQANPTAEENGEKVTQKRGLEDEDE